MVVVSDTHLLPPLEPPLEVDVGAAKRALRRQIDRLEQELADVFVSAFPRTPLELGVPAGGGPRILGIAELEAQRDGLQDKLRAARHAIERRGLIEERNRALLERMLLEPKKHKFARVHRADVGMGGCGAYEVRPRLGLIGMLMGWWQVKLSSGCPLAT